VRQLHATQEAGLGERLQRGPDLRDQRDRAVAELGLVLVGAPAVRGEALGRDPLGQLEHVVVELARVLGVAVALAQALDVQPLVEQEGQVAPREDRRRRAALLGD
jgi:hypothetical protein